MNETDFAGLLRGVKEMAVHVKGEVVPGVVETRIDPPDVRRIREAVNVTQRELASLLGDGLEWDSAVTWPDVRRDYGEPRQCGIGYVGLRLFFVVFVDRADGRRIISLRKANKREEKIYAST